MPAKKIHNFLLPFFVLVTIGIAVPCSYGEEEKNTKWGFSLLGGIGEAIHPKPDMRKCGILPRLSIPLHGKWDLEIEGNYSYWAIDHETNLYFLGAGANILFKPIQWKKGALFFLAGGGLGYDNSDGRVEEIGDSHFAGILQGGVGIFYKVGKRLILRGEYRLNHVSEPFRTDDGLNTHDFLLGISF